MKKILLCKPMAIGAAILLNLFLIRSHLEAQNPTSCASIGSRANSNGQASSCPNVSGTLYAANFLGTAYATVPSSSKTGNLQFVYPGINLLLTPYAITRVWLTTSGTSLTSVAFGPAGAPSISGGNTVVNYCFYGANLATIGTLSFELTDPQTGLPGGICSFDASCNSNCTVVANPGGIILPVVFSYFRAVDENDADVRLEWGTGQEQNNKGFEIQRKTADSGYATIAFVSSSHSGGISSGPTSYQYTDAAATAGSQLEYRIRQVDLDGRPYYSAVVSIRLDGRKQQARIYNSGNTVVVGFPGAVSPAWYDLSVYDSQGKKVRHQHISAPAGLTIPDLPGHQVYYISIRNLDGSGLLTRAVYVQ